MIKLINQEQIEPYLDLLAEVEHTALNRSNPAHEQWLRRRVSSFFSRGAVFLALHEDEAPNEMIGIISVLHDEAPEGIDSWGARAEVLQIGVSKSYRRRGAGSLLLQQAQQYARDRGAYCLFMMTYAEDYDVIAFYGKNGFIPVATIPDVFGPGLEGNVVLRKIIG